MKRCRSNTILIFFLLGMMLTATWGTEPDTFKQKRILVTGGAGFLGSHLCRALVAQGHKVICMDNLFTGSKKNIQKLLKNPNFTFVIHDVSSPFDYKVDEIYNLACPASPPHYQLNPIQTLKTSIYGALHVLELARKYDAKVFQASTSEVYGDSLIHPQTEIYWGNVNPIGIRACYDEGKRCAETFFFEYHRKYRTKIKVARIFNTYGPNMRMDDGRVISNFILQALQNQPITIYGEGNQTRSFCYVSDLISAIITFMNTEDSFIGPVNLGNPEENTILEVAELAIRKTKSQSTIIHKPIPADDPRQRCPDISLAKTALRWEPQVSLDKGLEKTIQYFKKELGTAHINIE